MRESSDSLSRFQHQAVHDLLSDNHENHEICVTVQNGQYHAVNQSLSQDADKTDIFRVHIEDPVDDFLFIKDDEIKQSKISKEIEKQFYEGHCIVSGGRKSVADVYVMRLAFMYDVNYVPALEYIQKQNYLRRMIDRIGFENPDTIHTFDAMLQTIEKNMKKRIETNE